VMLQLNNVRGDHFSYCFNFRGMDFEGDGAIALDNPVNLKNSWQVSPVPFFDVSQLSQEE
jgi:hypothetical protein